MANRHSKSDEIGEKKVKMLEDIALLAQTLGRTPTVYDIDRASREKRCLSARTYARIFNVANAQQGAGLKPNMPNGHKHKYTKDDILVQLCYLAIKFEKSVLSLTSKDIEKGCSLKICPNHQVIRSHFGTIDQARLQASKICFWQVYDLEKINNVSAERKRKYSHRQAFDQIWELYRQLGRLPGIKDLKTANQSGACPSIATVYTLFDNIKKLKRLLLFRECGQFQQKQN
jgi:hypothetical protein